MRTHFRIDENDCFQGTRGRLAAEYLCNVISAENIPQRGTPRRAYPRQEAGSTLDAVEDLLRRHRTHEAGGES